MRRLTTRTTRRVARALLLGCVISVGVAALSHVGVFAGWETRALDTFLFFRERTPSPAVVVVAIDDDAFLALGERQPLDRRFLADLTDFLLKSGARVVALDIQLTRATSPADDAALVAVTHRWPAGRVVYASSAEARADGRYEMVGSFSRELIAVPGFANAPIGDDRVIRRMIPVLPAAGGGLLPSFALAAAAGAVGDAPGRVAATLRPGKDVVLPVSDPSGRVDRNEPVSTDLLAQHVWRIDFTGAPGAMTMFPAGALVQMARTGVTPTDDNPFNGRIVLVGATYAESRDVYPTPMGFMSGVEIQANMIHTLLARRALLPPNVAVSVSLLGGACLAAALFSLWLRPLWAATATAAVIALVAVLSYEAYTRGGYWLDFVAPMVGMTAYLQWSRRLARRRLHTAFGQYVSPEVLERVLRDGSDLTGETRTVSILMSDVRGFTTLAERMSPAEITAVMNEYFTAMVDIVLAHHGMVSDFIGDGLLAVFGAPVDDPEHAWHAVAAALDMQQAVVRLNAQWQARGGVTLAIGMAINTGEVFAGNMGSPKKKKYAVVGDPVNTTARMEGLNREFGTTILISRPTMAAVEERVVVRDCGSVAVKGKTETVEIFELLGARGAPQEAS